MASARVTAVPHRPDGGVQLGGDVRVLEDDSIIMVSGLQARKSIAYLAYSPHGRPRYWPPLVSDAAPDASTTVLLSNTSARSSVYCGESQIELTAGIIILLPPTRCNIPLAAHRNGVSLEVRLAPTPEDEVGRAFDVVINVHRGALVHEQGVLISCNLRSIHADFAAVLAECDRLRALAIAVGDIDVVNADVVAMDAKGSTCVVRARIAGGDGLGQGDLVGGVGCRVTCIAVNLRRVKLSRGKDTGNVSTDGDTVASNVDLLLVCPGIDEDDLFSAVVRQSGHSTGHGLVLPRGRRPRAHDV